MKNLKQQAKQINSQLLMVLALSFLVFGCSKDDDTLAPIVNKATSIELVSGENQTGFTEQPLTNPIEIIVKDKEGNPFDGATVSFSVDEGSISSDSAITSTDGKATVLWTLGTTQGNQNLTVSIFKSDGITPLTGSSITIPATSVRPIVVGDFHEGGVVFFVDDSKIHGLVCATRPALGTLFEWGCRGTEISGADNLEIGGGQQNTLDIVNDCNSDSDIAAIQCDVFFLNGFSDWFLPSKLELNQMAIHRDLINATATANGGLLFNEGTYYWSSSEFSPNSALARSFDGIAVSFTVIDKFSTAIVRPVRAF